MFEVTFAGLAELERELGALTAGVSDFTEPFTEAGARLGVNIHARFLTGGQPDGWPAVQPDTILRRIGDKSAPPLTDTGGLDIVASLAADGSVTVGNRSGTVVITPLSFTKTVEGDDVHALEAGYLPHNLPARPFFELRPADEEDVTMIFSVYLNRLVMMGGAE